MINWLKNMKVSKKMTVMVAVAIAGLLVIGGVAYYDLRQAMENQDAMYYDALLPVSDIKELRLMARGVLGSVGIVALTSDSRVEKEAWDDIAKRIATANEVVQRLEQSANTPKEREYMERIKVELADYQQARDGALEMMKAGKKREGYQLFEDKALPKLNSLNALLVEYSRYLEDEAKKIDAAADDRMATAVTLLVGVVAFVPVLLLALAVAIIRSITRPLTANRELISHMARGDFSRQVPDEFVRSADEFGDMARAMREMVGLVNTLFQRISHAAEQVAASSQELTASADQSAQAANQVAASVTDIAQATERQNGSIGETSAVIEEMSASIEQVAATANHVSANSAQMVKDAEEGGKAADTAIQQMGTIKGAVDNLAGVINKLGEQSQAIGQIVNTIASIAAQTNLLALNAAIEAARAGEQGRGFAVVAEEVRKLAEQSQDAAKQISGLIVEIQRDTESAVTAMNQGAQEVRTGAEVVTSAAGRFRAIAQAVAGINSQMREVSSAIEEMARGSQRIVHSIKDIDRDSKGITQQAQTVSAAVEETSASMEEIASSSRALAGIAGNMQEAVSQFRL
ncbi:MAG: methyl-accepting chemotaxis protein [Negativicutes bacterium]|nr:methyl-accepting chemotaxis protein [Negativicutes bacterium]